MMVVNCVGRPVGTGVGDKSVTMAAWATSVYLKLPATNDSVMMDASDGEVGVEEWGKRR